MVKAATKEAPKKKEKAPPQEPRIGEGFPAAKAKAKSAIDLDLTEPEEKEKEQCPHCGKSYKFLERHLTKCKEAPKGAALDPKLMELITAIRARLGEASVKTVVHILQYAKQRKTGDPKAQFDAPIGWVEETGELHGMLIEYLLARWGPEESETYVMLISLVVQWYGVIQINFIEPGASGTKAGTIGTPKPSQTDDKKQPNNLRSEGVRQDTNRKVSDETGTPIINP